MKAIEILNHFLFLHEHVDREKTVDGILLGDPEKDIRNVLVTWICGFDALQAAVERRVDMIVTHEPTFYDHFHERERLAEWSGSAKKRFIEEHGLVILRNHDVWDLMPGIGIPWAWARFLGLGKDPAAISEDLCHHRYDIDLVDLDTLASRVAGKTALLGEPFVQVSPGPGGPVSRVGIGTGCGCRLETFKSIGCDVMIVSDDGTFYWSELQRAKDEGMAFIRVNHGVSEDPGMSTLTNYINENLSGVAATHWVFRGAYRLIGGER